MSIERVPLDEDAWFLDDERKETDLEYYLDPAIENLTIEQRIAKFKQLCRDILSAHRFARFFFMFLV